MPQENHINFPSIILWNDVVNFMGPIMVSWMWRLNKDIVRIKSSCVGDELSLEKICSKSPSVH